MSWHEFDTTFKSKHIAPDALHDGTVDFPMEAVVRRLDGQGGDGESVDSASHRAGGETTAFVLRQLMDWVKQPCKASDQRAVKTVGLRFLAAMWVINPGPFNDAPAHIVATSYGLHPSKFKTYTAEFSRRFGIRNQFQVHDWQNLDRPKGAPNFAAS